MLDGFRGVAATLRWNSRGRNWVEVAPKVFPSW